jgi:hypothetical protein
MVGDISGKELTAEAKLQWIGPPAGFGPYIDNPVAPGIDIHGTSHAAKDTGSFPRLAGQSCPFSHFFRDGASGTDINACSAEFTAGLDLGFIEGSADNGGITPLYESQYMAVPLFVANPDTATAENTEVIIQVIKWIFFLRGDSSVGNRELYIIEFKIIDQVLEFTIPIGGAEITPGDRTGFPGSVHEIRAFFFILANQAGVRMF